jgi:lipoprotein-anchoring transpeptidase ErfK/SrfK
MLRLLLLVVMAGLIAAPAQARGPARDELSVEDQPGYEPSQDEEDLPAAYKRQVVYFRTAEPPGTIVVSVSQRFLYVVQGNNRALRYGIGVGREGF